MNDSNVAGVLSADREFVRFRAETVSDPRWHFLGQAGSRRAEELASWAFEAGWRRAIATVSEAHATAESRA